LFRIQRQSSLWVLACDRQNEGFSLDRNEDVSVEKSTHQSKRKDTNAEEHFPIENRTTDPQEQQETNLKVIHPVKRKHTQK
jgi:hypothetical protein